MRGGGREEWGGGRGGKGEGDPAGREGGRELELLGRRYPVNLDEICCSTRNPWQLRGSLATLLPTKGMYLSFNTMHGHSR